MKNYKITKLQVQNFRNLSNQLIQFSPKINCILGENGNGKTNILEAIHVISSKKSFRKNQSFPQFLSVDCEKPEIIFSSVFIDFEENPFSYSSKMTSEEMAFFQNGKPIKKRIDIKTVFINPFDSYGFHTNSSDRREWIDRYLSLLDEHYKKTLSRYQTLLKFRNTLLSKKPPKYVDQLKATIEDFAVLSFEITQKRLQFLNELAPFMNQTFKELFLEVHDLHINLDSRIGSMSPKDIALMYANQLEKDIERSMTSYGPHKDDYVLLFDGFNSFDFCSLGQQKMSYLSLLFAYIELFRYKYSSYPIVLIDDVSGELDQHRWRRLVEYLEKSQFQVLVTTANEKFKEELERIEGANKIHIKNGSILNQ